jgi:hypothetical protein
MAKRIHYTEEAWRRFVEQHGYPPDFSLNDLRHSLARARWRLERVRELGAPQVVVDGELSIIASRTKWIAALLKEKPEQWPPEIHPSWLPLRGGETVMTKIGKVKVSAVYFGEGIAVCTIEGKIGLHLEDMKVACFTSSSVSGPLGRIIKMPVRGKRPRKK